MKGVNEMMKINLLRGIRKKKGEKKIMKKIWENNIVYTLIWTAITGLTIWIVIPKDFSKSMKLFIIASPILFLLSIVSLIILATAIIAASALKKAQEETKEDAKQKEKYELLNGIVRNVPANQVWIVRNAFRSGFNEEKKKWYGYKIKKTGWNFYIPGLQIDMGIFDLSPIPRDPAAITVNTQDNQTALVDWRIISQISSENNTDMITFAVKVNGNREEFENQRANVVFNQLCSEKTQDDLTSFKNDKLEELSDEAVKRFNQHTKEKLGIIADSLEIKKILMPEEIRAAAEYQTVAKKRQEVASIRGDELSIIIEATKANPTKVVMLDILRETIGDLVTPLVNAFRTHQETKKS